jgi:hypothetical protein
VFGRCQGTKVSSTALELEPAQDPLAVCKREPVVPTGISDPAGLHGA